MSSERLVNGLRDRGHTVLVVHVTESLVSPDPGTLCRTAIAGVNVPSEPEAMFRALRRRMEGSIMVGFGADRAGYFAVLWALWLGLKSLVLFRGNDFDRIIHDVRRGWMTHFILDKATMTGAVSREMLTRITTLRKADCSYTPNGIDTSVWVTLESDLKRAQEALQELKTALPNNPGRPLKNKKIAGIFGYLKYKKGLDMAVDLFSNFGLGTGAYLMAVGDVPEEMRKFIQYAQSAQSGQSGQTGQAELSNPVESAEPAESAIDDGFWIEAGYKDRDELPAWYALSDVVLIPSHYDGMPNVMLEAMSLGRVVVANRSGGMPDVIENGVNGFLFDGEDRLHAARVLETALSLPASARDEIGKNARETIERGFTAAHEIDGIEAALSAGRT
ncbi:MAG: glycosyltransferase family 4 protein [Nitrospirae bacterium]|nr:glycosyltransferase family 4 protein [Nitrospirota bacterium]